MRLWHKGLGPLSFGTMAIEHGYLWFVWDESFLSVGSKLNCSNMLSVPKQDAFSPSSQWPVTSSSDFNHPQITHNWIGFAIPIPSTHVLQARPELIISGVSEFLSGICDYELFLSMIGSLRLATLISALPLLKLLKLADCYFSKLFTIQLRRQRSLW